MAFGLRCPILVGWLGLLGNHHDRFPWVGDTRLSVAQFCAILLWLVTKTFRLGLARIIDVGRAEQSIEETRRIRVCPMTQGDRLSSMSDSPSDIALFRIEMIGQESGQ